MPDPTDLVKRLRTTNCASGLCPRLMHEAATAIETILAQRAVLVREVEAWREWRDRGAYLDDVEDNRPGSLAMEMLKARAATDAAFKGGLPK